MLADEIPTDSGIWFGISVKLCPKIHRKILLMKLAPEKTVVARALAKIRTEKEKIASKMEESSNHLVFARRCRRMFGGRKLGIEALTLYTIPDNGQGSSGSNEVV